MSQKDNQAYLAFNRGMISPLGLARIDLKRTSMSAETQTNWIPRVLGSTMLRPGLAYKGSSDGNNEAVHVPFLFSITDKAILEFTSNKMRVLIDDTPITRSSVSTTVTNGDFTSDITTGWTDSDEAGATSSWSAGSLAMIGNSTGSAYCRQDQEITVAVGDQNVEHALRLVVGRGPIEIKVGSTQGGQEYFGYSLGTGTHSLSFTPTGNFWIRIRSRKSYTTLLDSVNVESSGAMEIATGRYSDDLDLLRWDQSGDIVFIACAGKQQTKVERRTERSWSWVEYEADNGPYLLQNSSATTLLPDALNGDVTLTASADLFEQDHVGALFSITSTIQNVTAENIGAEDTWTDYIKVTGITSARIFTIEISGRTDSTITLQRSLSAPGTWSEAQTYTANTVVTYDDGLDNQEAYYRIGIAAGDYGTDSVDVSLLIESGSITGICRITAVASATSASAVVLQNFGSDTEASSTWSEGRWSSKNGFPTAVGFHEGRLFWAGKDRLNGSVSDSFYDFDPDTEGDSAPIDRTIGQGPVDNINWLASGKALLLGCESSVKSARSSNLDEPLTKTNITIKDIATQGTSDVMAVKVDGQVLFVQSSGVRIYEVGFDPASYAYSIIDLTSIVPEVGEPEVTKIVVQRQPDTRIHCIRSDGTVAMLVYDKIEEVKCWVLIETDGSIEDAIVMPGLVEDEVYYHVNRTINGSTYRFLEKWTLESENKGGAITKLADSHIIYSGASTDTITGLSHLEGESVVVWGNTKDLGTYTVSSGQITLSEEVTWACVGLTYQADFKSAKPALSTPNGNSLLQKKIISHLGVLMADTHPQGLKYGPDFDNLDDLPGRENGVDVDSDDVWSAYDEEAFTFPGTWDTDSRVCLRAMSPKPVTLLAIVAVWNTNERV